MKITLLVIGAFLVEQAFTQKYRKCRCIPTFIYTNNIKLQLNSLPPIQSRVVEASNNDPILSMLLQYMVVIGDPLPDQKPQYLENLQRSNHILHLDPVPGVCFVQRRVMITYWSVHNHPIGYSISEATITKACFPLRIKEAPPLVFVVCKHFIIVDRSVHAR